MDSVIKSTIESDDIVLNITNNTKMKNALERVFSREKDTNVAIFANNKGIQKLVSVVGLINDKLTSEKHSLVQLNCFTNDNFYVYFDFSNNKTKQESLLNNGWVYNNTH